MQRRYVSYQWSGVGTGWKNSLLGRDWTSFINIWTVIDCWGCFLFPLRLAVGTFCYQNTLHLISYLDGCSCWSSINYASIKNTWHFFSLLQFFFFFWVIIFQGSRAGASLGGLSFLLYSAAHLTYWLQLDGASEENSQGTSLSELCNFSFPSFFCFNPKGI